MSRWGSLPVYSELSFKSKRISRVAKIVLPIILTVLGVALVSETRTFHHVSEIVSDAATALVGVGPNTISPIIFEAIGTKYAFATLLTHEPASEDLDQEYFFTAVRILTFQLLHNNETRSRAEYPLIVLVNKEFPQEKRDRLQRDGAVVWQPDDVNWGWLRHERKKLRPDWQSVLLKLRLWDLVQFDRVCFLDGDTILNRNIDGIFDDPAVQTQTTGTNEISIQRDEADLPSQYVFAGTVELTWEHFYPPLDPSHDWYRPDYFNGGFFVLQPSGILLEYYFSLLQIPGRFEADFPEQNLWNYAHRRDGNMPWTSLSYEWNTHFPSLADKDRGVATMHTHWWRPIHDDLQHYLDFVHGQMEGFYQAHDAMIAQTETYKRS